MPTNLCLDFGTAFSKASAWTEANRPIPLNLGEVAGYGGCSVPTTVLVTRDHRMYFGEDAILEGRDIGIPAFSNLKWFLTRQYVALDQVPLDPTYNPTRLAISMRDVISLYMGFLSYVAVEASEHLRHDSLRKTITMPVFSGRQGEHLDHELRLCADYGWRIKDEFVGVLDDGIDLKSVLRRLRRLRPRGRARRDHSIEIAEPLAAIAARMATYSPDREKGRRLSLVIDFGAGTVDFGLFVSGLPDEHIGVHPVAGAKYSLPVGGNDIDAALVACVLDKAGLPRRHRSELKAALQEQARGLKEELLGMSDDDRLPIADARTSLTREEFLLSSQVRQIADAVKHAFRARLENIHWSWLELASTLTHAGIGVFITGGGATLPFLRDMIPVNSPQTVNGSAQFYLRVATEAPAWASQRGFVASWRQIEDDYSQLAVAIGGAVFGAGVNEYLAFGHELTQWGGATRR